MSLPASDPALIALARAGPDRPLLLLHSGRADPRWATRSLVATPRLWFRYSRERGSELFEPRTLRPVHRPALTHRPWRDLRCLLNAPDLPGLWVGYIGYDAARLLEAGKLAPSRPTDRPWPVIELGWCPDVQRLAPPASAPSAAPGRGRRLASNFDRAAYERAVERILAYIAAGDVFQVNLAQRLTGTYRGSPRALFDRLARISPAWYGAYLELPGGWSRAGAPGSLLRPERAICSTSPELFLEVEGRAVVTRPIKGTRPAACDPRELWESEKDAAELHMIVDLMRNDLGRVCSYGSVRVPQSRTIESHPTVHHGVATVTGQLHRSKDLVDLLRATLPGGSVTGAPKVRAMQIIDELEPHPRGPYCGCIGYLSRDAACLNVAIRTMLLTDAALPEPDAPPAWTVDLPVGGGIVADSEPAAEYDETLAKAQAMRRALGSAEGPF